MDLSSKDDSIGWNLQTAAVGILWPRQRQALRSRDAVNSMAYGIRHATRALVDAFLTFLPQPISVYARSCSLNLARQRLDTLLGPSSLNGPQRRLVQVSSLIEDWSGGRVGLWFNPTGDIAAPFNFRSVLGLAEVPVASLHHTISYQQYLQTKFPLLLLSRPRPFDAIICTSHAAKRAVEQAIYLTAESLSRSLGIDLPFNGKLPILPLGVDTDIMRPRGKEAARVSLGLDNRDVVLLFLGRTSVVDKGDLVPWLRTLCRLPQHMQKHLVIVIAGQQEQSTATELDRFLNSEHPLFRINARGFIPERAKPLVYSAADIFISPSDSVQEMFGLTPLEAMACGVPQIVSDWDGYRDIVEDGKTGFLIPTVWGSCTTQIDALSLLDPADWQDTHFHLGQSVAVDCEVFLERIKLMIEDSQLRARMSSESRQRAVELFSWPTVVQRYRELFGSLVDEARSCTGRSGDCSHRSVPQPRYFDLFCHFATATLEPSTLLCPSTQRFQDSQLAEQFPYPDLQDLNPDIISLIDDVMASDHGQIRVQEVIETCQQATPDLEQGVVWRHLMWLIKYGFVRAA